MPDDWSAVSDVTWLRRLALELSHGMCSDRLFKIADRLADYQRAERLLDGRTHDGVPGAG